MRTLKTRKGKTVDTPFTDDEAMDRLRDIVKNTESARTNEFMLSLSKRDADRLSPDQITWVHVFAVRDSKPSPNKLAGKIVKDFVATNLVALMNKAAAAQKRWPKIVLAGMTLLRKPNGEILVRNASKQRIAIIANSGHVLQGSMNDRQLDVLKSMSENPEKVASQHGIATGQCCFCNTLLSTMESRSVGYGPICAAKFGLPWGKSCISIEVRHAQLSAKIQEAENEATL